MDSSAAYVEAIVRIYFDYRKMPAGIHYRFDSSVLKELRRIFLLKVP